MSDLHLITGYAGKEHITAVDDGSYNVALWGSGDFVLERGEKFSALVISNNKIRISPGDLMMQGRHVRLVNNFDLSLDNGAQGYYRNDLIVARYKKDASSDIETAELAVIKGTPVASNPADPAHTTGDLVTGAALLHEMPLYRVEFNGINISKVTSLFSVVTTLKTLEDKAQQKVDAAILEMQGSVVDDYSAAMAVTENNIPVGCKAFKAGIDKINKPLVNQNFPNATTKLSASAWQTTVSTGITVTFPESGYYLVIINSSIQPDGTGIATMRIACSPSGNEWEKTVYRRQTIGTITGLVCTATLATVVNVTSACSYHIYPQFYASQKFSVVGVQNLTVIKLK